MTPAEPWLAELWPVIAAGLPAPPGAVVEIGCGPRGGFVPMLRSAGYDAVGVDPDAPDGRWYHRVEFEGYDPPPEPVLAVVACTSLHHTADVGAVLDLVRAALMAGGSIVVVEWARERFDEATARWCFDRLPSAAEPGWLQQLRDEWRASGQRWDAYFGAWAQAEGMHAGQYIVRELDARFDRQLLGYGPYFFADLADVSQADEQFAIDAGQIQANRIGYVGRRP